MARPPSIHTVASPNQKTEQVEPYYRYVRGFLVKHYGAAPSRTTLLKWITNGRGYPVLRGGPYLALPVFRRLKRPMTTRQAMSRWLTRLRVLEREVGQRG